jgi:hypothetical protein
MSLQPFFRNPSMPHHSRCCHLDAKHFTEEFVHVNRYSGDIYPLSRRAANICFSEFQPTTCFLKDCNGCYENECITAMGNSFAASARLAEKGKIGIPSSPGRGRPIRWFWHSQIADRLQDNSFGKARGRRLSCNTPTTDDPVRKNYLGAYELLR